MDLLIELSRLQAHGIFLITGGLIIRFIVARRRFNRRGIGGVQLFNSYLEALLVSAIEALLYFIGKLAILSGLFLLAV